MGSERGRFDRVAGDVTVDAEEVIGVGDPAGETVCTEKARAPAVSEVVVARVFAVQPLQRVGEARVRDAHEPV
jgi:hypothetical protein